MFLINLLCVNLAIFSPLTSYKAVNNHTKIAIIHFLLVAVVWVRNVPLCVEGLCVEGLVATLALLETLRGGV